MVKITLINGDAGTGKTFKLTKYINNVIDKNKTFICLAFTHSAVNNLYDMFRFNYPNKLIDKEYFQTIHKYFKIDPKKETINNYSFNHIDYMFIDEYSLISVNLLELIKDIIKKHVDRLVLCGDFKQLRTIDSKTNINYVSLNKYAEILNEYNFDKDIIKAIQLFDNSILSTKFINKNITDIVILKEHIRNDDKILEIINNICFKEIDNEYIKTLYCCKSSLVDLMKNKGYAFIASTYDNLQKVNNMLSSNEHDTIEIKQKDLPSEYGLNNINLKYNQKVVITETLKYGDDIITNGDILIFKEYNNKTNTITIYDDDTDKYFIISPQVVAANNNKIPKDFSASVLGKFKYNDVIYYSYFPILPNNLITYHKAQGKTIDNVILCVDNIFEFSMLYTGLTRAKNNVLLFSFSEQIKNIKNVNTIYEYLNIMINELLYKEHTIIQK